MDEDNEFFPHAIFLGEATPEFVFLIKTHLEQKKSKDAVEVLGQLDRVSVRMQRMTGGPESFSFMAFPIPRLDRKEREKATLQPSRSIEIQDSCIRVRIDLDDFGQINWFHIDGRPDVFRELSMKLHGSTGSQETKQ